MREREREREDLVLVSSLVPRIRSILVSIVPDSIKEDIGHPDEG